MYAFRQLAIFLGLSVFFVLAGLSGILPVPGFFGPTAALAQQFKEPFQFRVRNNSTAASLAIYLKQMQDGTSSTSSSGGSGAASIGTLNQYSSTTIGNLTEITTILEQGAEGYVGVDTSQDSSNSSQSASSQGTQVYGGNTALGNIENAQATTNGQTTTQP